MVDPSPAERVAVGGEPFVHLVPPGAEVTISRELVRTLLAEQHPDLAGRDIAGPFEGFDMAVFRLGEDLAVRLPRHQGSVPSLESEIRWIGRLGERWTSPTQRIVRVGRPGPEYPWNWAVTSWLPGELAADRPLDAAAAPELGRALARSTSPRPPTRRSILSRASRSPRASRLSRRPPSLSSTEKSLPPSAGALAELGVAKPAGGTRPVTRR